MRNLTIKRDKSFVGCIATMQVYIVDSMSNELVMNNVNYRKIGTLKNGETKTFVIDQNECNVVVIADKISKGFCSEVYRVPQGEYDIFISGKNKFNPIAGNAFRFNGIPSADMLQNRKKGFRKGLVVISLIIVVFAAVGFFVVNWALNGIISEPKEFSKEGMTLTLTKEFTEQTQGGYTVCYGTKDVACLALKEPFSLAEGFEDYTLDEYGDLVLESNSLKETSKLQNSDGLTYFEYEFTHPETKELYHYFSAVFKASDSFWLVQFATLEKDFDANREDIVKWLNSIEF